MKAIQPVKLKRPPAMRIGVDMHTFDGIHQGSRTHCLELFSRAMKMGDEFQFFVFLAEPEKLKEATARYSFTNVEFVKMDHRNSAARLLFQLPALCRKYGLDLLHTQYISPPFSPCPTAVTVHDILFESHPRFFTKSFQLRSKILVRSSARKSALVFTVSEFSRQELIRLYNLRGDRVTTVENGVDLVRFHPGSDGADVVHALGLDSGNYLLTVGRLEPRKNHAGLLRAYSKLPRPRPKLAIVGQRDFGYLEIFKLIESLGVKDEVIVFESVEDSMLPALYRHALAFVYPTWAEGFGMPILEAMASGVPVLTSPTTALPEVAGEAAIYLQPEDTTSIAAAMLKIISDADLRSLLIQRGFARTSLFCWDQSAFQLVRSYREYFSAVK
jgi:glycosyltransferase involved in cell wall biosynthesis